MNKYLIGQSFMIPLVTDEVPAGQAVAYSISATRLSPDADVQPEFGESKTVADNPTGKFILGPTVEEVGRRSVWQLGWILEDAQGVNHTYSEVIMMEASDTLVKGENSFQGYWEAIMLAEELPGMDSFKAMEKSEQIAAMITSYRLMAGMTFMSKGKIIWDITSLNAEELDTLDPGLLEALCIAQLVEANESLDSNSSQAKRLDGIMSETIGESSMMFRSGKVATNSVLSRRSMGFLRKYLVITARIERV